MATWGTPGAQAQSVDDLRSEREAARRAAAEAAAEIDELQAADQDLADALADLEAHISLQEGRIAGVQEAIAQREAEVAAAQQSARQLALESEEIRLRLQRQAVDAFVAPSHDVLDELNSTDLLYSALRRSFLGEIVGDERTLIDELRANRAEQQQTEERAAALLVEIEGDRAILQARLDELEVSRQEAEQLRAEVAERIADWVTLRDEMQAADEAATAEIARLEEQRRRAEEEERRRNENYQPPANVGEFVVTHRPVPGRITSQFGGRVHPIFGTVRMHYGVDMDGDTGEPIEAAASGVVLSSGWRNGYGYTVVLSHGGGVTTLYAHQSELLVSAGDSVVGGQTIGRLGSTGWSTGPHLHFEIRVNSAAIDPAPFL